VSESLFIYGSRIQLNRMQLLAYGMPERTPLNRHAIVILWHARGDRVIRQAMISLRQIRESTTDKHAIIGLWHARDTVSWVVLSLTSKQARLISDFSRTHPSAATTGLYMTVRASLPLTCTRK
jgi:hypothetical protein